MAKMAKSAERVEISEIQMREIYFHVLGDTPLIMNRFSQKAWQELLFPSKQKNRAGLEQSLKHDPMAEYQGAMYLNRDPKSKALIHMPNGAFHGALASAALDLPGAKKAQIERLTKIVDLNVDLYGVPQIFCAMVRNSDMARTPDVRTRPIFPEWAATVTVRYVSSILSERDVANLFAAAGRIVGVGDWRPQKGGPYGSFLIADDNNKEFERITRTQGRAAQQTAFDHPAHFDLNTEELLQWFAAEVKNREMSGLLKTVNKGKSKLPKVPVISEKGNGIYAGAE